jgi:hypothetical protein
MEERGINVDRDTQSLGSSLFTLIGGRGKKPQKPCGDFMENG